MNCYQQPNLRTPEAAKFFRYMVENEAKHGRELLARHRRLDAVVLTHPHDDHVAGLAPRLSR